MGLGDIRYSEIFFLTKETFSGIEVQIFAIINGLVSNYFSFGMLSIPGILNIPSAFKVYNGYDATQPPI